MRSTRTRIQTGLLLLIAVFGMAAGGPALSGCSRSRVTVESESSKTLGQELDDLDKAYRDGVITREEYEKAKKKLLEEK